jgi:hypothetical protein
MPGGGEGGGEPCQKVLRVFRPLHGSFSFFRKTYLIFCSFTVSLNFIKQNRLLVPLNI